jgi:NAD(P)-dependent dehydrogenase (short-subunit alcohol dehydrogenase family)
MGRLHDKVALISGAGAGIGRAAALLFAREGARVAIAELDEARGRETERQVLGAGGEAVFLATDVTSEASVRQSVAAAVARFGRLDILFNCAGGSLPEDSEVTDPALDLERVWGRTMPLDLRGTIHCCRHAIPVIAKAGGGAVVNMSSGAALRGASPAHLYTAAKGAILALTRALAGAHAKEGIRVNAICAGRILTERIVATYGRPGEAGPVVDRQRSGERAEEYPFWVGEPADIAAIALFLASAESRMITGAAIPADGGRSAY